jgi:hypothetical protein
MFSMYYYESMMIDQNYFLLINQLIDSLLHNDTQSMNPKQHARQPETRSDVVHSLHLSLCDFLCNN